MISPDSIPAAVKNLEDYWLDKLEADLDRDLVLNASGGLNHAYVYLGNSDIPAGAVARFTNVTQKYANAGWNVVWDADEAGVTISKSVPHVPVDRKASRCCSK